MALLCSASNEAFLISLAHWFVVGRCGVSCFLDLSRTWWTCCSYVGASICHLGFNMLILNMLIVQVNIWGDLEMFPTQEIRALLGGLLGLRQSYILHHLSPSKLDISARNSGGSYLLSSCSGWPCSSLVGSYGSFTIERSKERSSPLT